MPAVVYGWVLVTSHATFQVITGARYGLKGQTRICNAVLYKINEFLLDFGAN
jgi:hypothetical protein